MIGEIGFAGFTASGECGTKCRWSNGFRWRNQVHTCTFTTSSRNKRCIISTFLAFFHSNLPFLFIVTCCTYCQSHIYITTVLRIHSQIFPLFKDFFLKRKKIGSHCFYTYTSIWNKELYKNLILIDFFFNSFI